MDADVVVPVTQLVFVLVVARMVWVALARVAAECERKRKRIARERKARHARRLERKAGRWFATTDVLGVVRPSGPGRRFAQTRANDLHDRERAVRRSRLDGWVPRVVVPLPPGRVGRRR